MNVFPPGTNHNIMADHDTRQLRLRAALLWMMSNSVQIRQRARAGEQVFIDLLAAHAKSFDFRKPSVDRFASECEILRAEYGDYIKEVQQLPTSNTA